MKHTHTVHCQICGSVQAFKNNAELPKHGYNVAEFGFFVGTCQGSHKKPLEQDKTLTVSIMKELLADAADLDRKVEMLVAGTLKPAQARTGTYERDERGRSREIMGPFAEQTVIKQREAIAEMKWRLEQRARWNRQHVAMLERLIKEVHGTEPKPVPVVNKPVVAPGAVVRIGGKDGYDATVVRIETREARGCGPHLNGQRIPHALIVREGKAGEFAYPVRSIRTIVKPA